MKINQDTVVAITGGSRGIGRAAAISFAKRGAKIILLARDAKKMEEVAVRVKELGSEALVISTDVSNEASCGAWVGPALKKFGKIDVLINNAGYGHYSMIENLKTADLDQIFRTNLYGALWCIQAVLPHMKERKQGHIVNVSTIISRRSIPFMSAYCMTKFAMNAMDEALRLEIKKHGIGVSLVCPGLTATDFQTNAAKVEFEPLMKSTDGMTSEKVGEAIVKAVQKNKRRVPLTMAGKALWTIDKFFPSVVDRIIYNMYGKQTGN